MSTDLLTKDEHGAAQAPPAATVAADEQQLRKAARRYVKRVHRLKVNAATWALGTIVVTALWVLVEWEANGAFERFGHTGEGDWNPTLWALAVGGWGLVVGIMALGVHFARPATEAEVDREVERLRRELPSTAAAAGRGLRRLARTRLERVQRLRFHVSAWILGMLVLTPLWALIEWQDNGGFERWSGNGNPGDWEPTILYVGGIWGFVIAAMALRSHFERPAAEDEVEREVERLRSRTER
jgi:hypothetical protein